MGCWAHTRRKFKDVPGKNGKAKQAIDYCNQIFKIERELQELSPEERYEQRQLQVKPVIEAFYDFLGGFGMLGAYPSQVQGCAREEWESKTSH